MAALFCPCRASCFLWAYMAQTGSALKLDRLTCASLSSMRGALGPPGLGCGRCPGAVADGSPSGCRRGAEICEQLRTLGSSLDWDRECFTMDAVSVFGELAEKGSGRDGVLGQGVAEKGVRRGHRGASRAPRWL